MDLALAFRVLRSYVWLLLIGLLVAVAAGVTAGYKVETGTFEPRAERQYSAATTILLSTGELALFEGTKEVPGGTGGTGATGAPTTVVARDLSQSAVIYAYVVSGSEVRALVENSIGALDEGEEIVGLQRTTQPTGSEQFPGRYNLPILEVVGVAQDAARAETIASEAVEAFTALAQADQDQAGVAPESRVQFDVIREGEAVEEEGRSPILLVTVVAIGVFVAFVALAFILYNLSLSRGRGRRRSPEADDVSPSSIGDERSQGATSLSSYDPEDHDRRTSEVRAR